jgi:hypothetical protein
MKRFLIALAVVSAGVCAQLPNGDPAGAIPVVVGVNPDGPVGIDGNTFTNVGEPSTLSAGLPATCSGSNTDVFFSFTAPNSAIYIFQTCTPTGFTAGTLTDTVVQVLDAAGTTALGCNDDSCGALSVVSVTLTAGTPVLVRVADFSATTINTGTFYVSISEAFPPANDACASAQTLVEGVVTAGTLFLATPTSPNPAGCTSLTATAPDAWYSYTPSVSGTVRIVRTGTGSNRVAAYTGTCGAETIVFSSCNTNLTSVFDVVAGTPYLIRVGATTGAGAFTILAETPVAQTPSADECVGATPLATGANAGTTVGATPSNPTTTCTQFAATTSDVWYQFTPAVNCAATLTRSSDGEGATRLAVYTTPDCVAFNNTGLPCSSGNSVSWVALAGTTYYVRVGVPTGGVLGPFLLFFDCAPFEPNDTCSGALPVVEGVNGPFNNTGTQSALETGFSSLCTTAGRDLFFTYSPACDGVVTMTTCGGNNVNEPGILIDSVLAAYDAWACGGTNTPLVCNDDTAGSVVCGPLARESTISFPVLAGTTYLVQVAGFSTTNFGTFNLTVSLATSQLVTIGTGCGPGATPTLVGSGPPAFGTTGTITVTAQPAAFGGLLASEANYGMVYAPFGPCTIYLLQPGMNFLLPVGTDALGQWSLSATFPAYDPVLDCYGIDLQAFVIGAGGIEFTNALRLVFGT